MITRLEVLRMMHENEMSKRTITEKKTIRHALSDILATLPVYDDNQVEIEVVLLSKLKSVQPDSKGGTRLFSGGLFGIGE